MNSYHDTGRAIWAPRRCSQIAKPPYRIPDTGPGGAVIKKKLGTYINLEKARGPTGLETGTFKAVHGTHGQRLRLPWVPDWTGKGESVPVFGLGPD